MILLSLAFIAYLIGSIPFGLLIGLAKGKDPRQLGSKNIGATNVGRILGGRYFALVFTLDMLKGLLPVLAASIFVAHLQHVRSTLGPATYALWILVGFAAIAGHMYSLYLGFKGGKGVATSAGVILGLYPYFTYPALVAIAVFGICLGVSRIVSLSSMLGAITLPIAYLVMGTLVSPRWPLSRQWPLLAFAILIAALIVYKHRENIRRLRLGTEARVGSHGPAKTA